MTATILLLTGMTPNAGIFSRLLPRLPSAIVVPWLPPCKRETLSDYARRLADSLQPHGEVIVCGVSFGGIVAHELAICLRARRCVVISAPQQVSELPPWFRFFRPFAALPVEPALDLLGRIAGWFPRRARTAATARMTKWAGDRGEWHRWATAAVLRWKPSPVDGALAVLQVHGSADTTFPLRYLRPDVVIANGGHVLPLTHDEQIAKLLRELAG